MRAEVLIIDFSIGCGSRTMGLLWVCSDKTWQ